MADALSLIPAAVLSNLTDKLYQKRVNAALEVEGIVRQLALAGDHDKITALINLLVNEYTHWPQGGMIGLVAVTVALASEVARHLDQIVPPILNSLSDRDNIIRYYACEALYNIAKVARGDFIASFKQISVVLSELSADPDANVQSAAQLLDRLVKDIVTESDQLSIEEFINPKYNYQICQVEDRDGDATAKMIPIESSSQNMTNERNLLPEDAECCICLCPYEDGTELHVLPCNHHSHSTCILKWLKINATCPSCKYDIVEGMAKSKTA